MSGHLVNKLRRDSWGYYMAYIGGRSILSKSPLTPKVVEFFVIESTQTERTLNQRHFLCTFICSREAFGLTNLESNGG